MRVRASRLVVVLLAVLIAENAWILYPRARAIYQRRQESPAARGRVTAARLGCFNCHGPGGRGGVPKPGSKWDTVPGFGGQTLVMFFASRDALREDILDRGPAGQGSGRTHPAAQSE